MEENASGVSKGRSIADGLSGAEIEPEEIITGRIINHLSISNSEAPSIRFRGFSFFLRIGALHAIVAKDQLILKLSLIKLLLSGVMSRFAGFVLRVTGYVLRVSGGLVATSA